MGATGGRGDVHSAEWGSAITMVGLWPKDLFAGRGDPFEPAEGADFLLLPALDLSDRSQPFFSS